MSEHIFNHKRPFYLENGFIILMACLWPLFGIPLVISIYLSSAQKRYDDKRMVEFYEALENDARIACEAMVDSARQEAIDIRLQAERDMINISEVNFELIKRKQDTLEAYNELKDKVIQLKQEEQAVKARLINIVRTN